PPRMAVGTDGTSSGAGHRGVGGRNRVIAVTSHAPRRPRRFERRFVRTLFEQLRLVDMAGRTYVLRSPHARRRSSVIPVASSTRRCAQVAAHGHCLMVNTLAVIGELHRRNDVSLHVVHIRVAMTASGGDVKRINARKHIAGRADVVNAMNVCAYSHVSVASCLLIRNTTDVVIRILIYT